MFLSYIPISVIASTNYSQGCHSYYSNITLYSLINIWAVPLVPILTSLFGTNVRLNELILPSSAITLCLKQSSVCLILNLNEKFDITAPTVKQTQWWVNCVIDVVVADTFSILLLYLNSNWKVMLANFINAHFNPLLCHKVYWLFKWHWNICNRESTPL